MKDYSSVQVELPGPMAAAVLALGKAIPDDALAEKGREDRPHITVCYGVESSDPASVRAIVEAAPPLRFELGFAGVFDSSPDFDVLYVSVYSPESALLRQRIIDSTPVTVTQPYYQPHVTLAYMQKGKAEAYRAIVESVTGMRGVAGDVTFSTPDKAETRIPLRSGAIFSAEEPNPDRWRGETPTAVVFESSTVETGDAEIVEVDGVEWVKGTSPIHVFKFGLSDGIDGRKVVFSPVDAQLLMSDFAARKRVGHNFIAITFQHGKDITKGAKSAGRIYGLELRGDGLYATNILWTKNAYAELKAGEWPYVSGEAYGEGDPARGQPFHPQSLAAVSLVYSPCIQGLNPVLASAEPAKITASGTEAQKEGHPMKRNEMAKSLGLPETCTDAELRAGQAAWSAANLSAEPPPTEDLAGKTKCSSCEKMSSSKDKCSLCGEKMQAMGAKPAAELAGLPAGFAEMLSSSVLALVPSITASILPSVTAIAEKKTAEVFEARQTAGALEAEIVLLEGTGQITPAEREDARKDFASNPAMARKLYGSRPKTARGNSQSFGAGAANALITGGDVAFTPKRVNQLFAAAKDDDDAAKRELRDGLTRTARYAAFMGLDFNSALLAVADGKDKDYSALIDAGFQNPQSFGAHFRRSLRAQDGLDLDLMKKIASQMKECAIPTSIIPEQLQRYAAAQTFAGLDNFQSPTREQLNLAIGYYQGTLIGSELMPEYASGVDLSVSYPVYGTEWAYIGTTTGVAFGQTDIPESTLEVDWVRIQTVPHANKVVVDRMLQTASSVLPGGGLLADVSDQALTIERTRKEVLQHDMLVDTANYASGFSRSFTGEEQWDKDASNPILPITGAMTQIQKATGVYPDIAGTSLEVVMALRRNKFLNELAGKYTASPTRPGGLLPLETLLAMFGFSWIVGTGRVSTTAGGVDPQPIWTRDLVLAISGRGVIKGPRLGITAVSAGYPKVRPIIREEQGPDGSDGVQVSDCYIPKMTLNNAGVVMKDVTGILTMGA